MSKGIVEPRFVRFYSDVWTPALKEFYGDRKQSETAFWNTLDLSKLRVLLENLLVKHWSDEGDCTVDLKAKADGTMDVIGPEWFRKKCVVNWREIHPVGGGMGPANMKGKLIPMGEVDPDKRHD